MKKITFSVALPVFTILLAGLTYGTTQAEVKRQLKAHEHGVSELMMALEQNKVILRLEAPGMDLVGFEHPAHSSADKRAVSATLDHLSEAGLHLFTPVGGHCVLDHHEATLLDDDNHSYTEHKDHDHTEQGNHTAFVAHYAFECANTPQALDATGFFAHFTQAQKLKVTVVSDKGQNRFMLDKDHPHSNGL